VTAAERGAAGGGVVERGWSDWEYSKSVLVKENSGATLTDYQVLLNLSGADFPVGAKSDGSDLRFVDAEEEEELSYWVEKFDAANETGKVWVKVPEIPADGEVKLKMLYGNPSAESVSNGRAVFEFFDDFEDGTWTDKYNLIESSSLTIQETGGTLYTEGSGIAILKIENMTTSDCEMYIEHKSVSSACGIDLDAGVAWYVQDISNYYGTYAEFDGDVVSIIKMCSAKEEGLSSCPIPIDTSWWCTKAIISGDSFSAKAWKKDTAEPLSWMVNATDDTFTAGELGIHTYTPVAGGYFDNFRIRKHADPEPTVTIEPGEEEEPTVSISTDKTTYTAGDTMNVEIEVANPTEDRLALQWWWLVPEYSVCVGLTAMPLSVPAGYDETLEYSFAVPELGAKWFSNAFFVQLAETEAGGGEGAGGEVLDADAACWIYRPAGRGVEAAQTAVGEAEVEIADEIRRAVEGVK